MTERWHGTAGGYTNHLCRCGPCTAAWRVSCASGKERRTQRPIPDHVHGSTNGYGNYGCRCEQCTTAWAIASRDRARRASARRASRSNTGQE